MTSPRAKTRGWLFASSGCCRLQQMKANRDRILGLQVALVLAFSWFWAAADEPPSPPDRFAPAGKDITWQVASRDMHSQHWELLASHSDPVTGKTTSRRTRFLEIGTGINFQDQLGNWHTTQEKFDLTPDGYAVAEFGPHKLVQGSKGGRVESAFPLGTSRSGTGGLGHEGSNEPLDLLAFF